MTWGSLNLPILVTISLSAVPSHFTNKCCHSKLISSNSYPSNSNLFSLGPLYMFFPLTIHLLCSCISPTNKQEIKCLVFKGRKVKYSIKEWVGSSKWKKEVEDALRSSLALIIFDREVKEEIPHCPHYHALSCEAVCFRYSASALKI